MANSKKNKSWLMPSFESEPVNKVSGVKRHISETPGKAQIQSALDIFPKKRNTVSLSKLLQACEPQKPSDLAISRQKQQEISNWLKEKVKHGRPSALILSGSSGCGKTTSIKILAKENGFDVTEWITPIDQLADENNRTMKQKDKFEEFLIRATRYRSVLCNHANRLLLVKDFPSIFANGTEDFKSVLEKYFEMGKEAIVFICTDTGNASQLRALFPSEIREKYGIDLININPVTQTAMKNALKRVTNSLNTIGGHLLHVSEQKIDEILANGIGDIRNAVINLIFISLKVSKDQSCECNSREESLGLLHGVGRVINPKRIQTANGWKFSHDPDKIASSFTSQSSTFLGFLQENYLNTMEKMEDVCTSANVLSLADVYNSEWRDTNLTKATLSFCVRGIMINNEKPVSGWNPVRKPQSDQPKMQRCVAMAETKWYETYIKSKSKNVSEVVEIDNEALIE